ncbi:hypothetical protein HYV44_03680 [Candidatus Microgenomates bacterium]|nr:hypothetical protein [Candidatus Microgenomates bacterium]
MEQKKETTIIIVIVLIAGIWLWSSHNTISDLQSQNSSLEDTIDEYRSALSEANDNIEQANSIIEDAKWYTWESYDDMGYALDSMDTVDTVSEP